MPTIRPTFEDTATEIKRIIRDQFQIDEASIRPESSFVADLGADSLRLVEMTLVFEEAFDIDIEDEDVAQILTVRDAIDYVEKRVMARQPD